MEIATAPSGCLKRSRKPESLTRLPKRTKATFTLKMLPLFTRAGISIPDHAPLLRELRLLERRTHKGGRDVIDHPRNSSDDLANALCGAANLAQLPEFSYRGWVSGPEKPPEDSRAREERVRNLIELLKCGERIPLLTMTKPLKIVLYGTQLATLLDDEVSISASGPECLHALAKKLVRAGHGNQMPVAVSRRPTHRPCICR